MFSGWFMISWTVELTPIFCLNKFISLRTKTMAQLETRNRWRNRNKNTSAELNNSFCKEIKFNGCLLDESWSDEKIKPLKNVYFCRVLYSAKKFHRIKQKFHRLFFFVFFFTRAVSPAKLISQQQMVEFSHMLFCLFLES